MDRDEEDRKVKRELMATAAMMGILAFPHLVEGDSTKHPNVVAKLSVQMADALLKELEKS